MKMCRLRIIVRIRLIRLMNAWWLLRGFTLRIRSLFMVNIVRLLCVVPRIIIRRWVVTCGVLNFSRRVRLT